MSLASKENCAVCDAELVHSATPVTMICAYCSAAQETLIYCPAKHYVCDACHHKEALEAAAMLLRNSTSRNPGELLEMLMAHTSTPMHGPEHHAFVPAVLAAGTRNAGCVVPDGALEEALRRGSKIPGGWCGYYGVCGAGAGVGVAVSILTSATPVRGAERTLANRATSLALAAIADGYPRCCKRASRKAIEVAVGYLRSKLGIALEDSLAPSCHHYPRNKECPLAACPYYPSDSPQGGSAG
jgi:hypothetical protein